MSKADQFLESVNEKAGDANVGSNIIKLAADRMIKDLKLMKDAKAALGASPVAKKAVSTIDKALKDIKKSL